MMSVYENQFDNDGQIFFQPKQNTENSTDFDLFGSEPTEISGERLNSEESTSSQVEEKAEIEGWRRAVRGDKKAIRQLQTFTGDVANLLYRKKSLDDLIEKCYFPIVQFDTKGELISFIAYDSYPNLPLAPSWTDWLNVNYKIDGVCPGNVFFVHYMVWQPKHQDKFLPLLLETSFTEFLFVKHIIIIQPPETDVPDFYEDYFLPVFPIGLEDLEKSSIQLLRLCLRSSIIHPLYIRSAFEQELDFIISVVYDIIRKTENLNSSFLCNLRDVTQWKEKKTLICEIEGALAGVMVINPKIDLDILNEGFNLAPFNGLRKKEFENEEVVEDELETREKDTLKPFHSNNILMSSKFFLSPINWELNLSNISSKDLHSLDTQSLNSSSDTDFSQFSIYHLSSTNELKRSNDSSELLFESKSDLLLKTGDIEVMIQTSNNTSTHFFPPKYNGQSNAFLIDFFAIDCNKIEEKLSSFDFLEAAFKAVPDREYCILLTPTNLLACPLLDLFVVSSLLFSFGCSQTTLQEISENSRRVTPRFSSSFKQELYLCHKNSLSAFPLSVRRAKKDDLADINNFLKNVNEGDIVYHDILTCFEENNHLKSFVLTFEDTIIGVSQINTQDHVELLRLYFEVPENVCASESSSLLKHLVINPNYNNHARFFIRDIMRLAEVTCLYYVNHKSPKNHRNLVTVLGEFAPVKPKKKVVASDLSSFTEKLISKDPFSLFILHPWLCGFNKIQMNIVIVVVGASRTAVSFLENLIFGPGSYFYCYNNIICVSPNGLEVDDAEENFQNLMFLNEDNFSRGYLSRLSLRTHISCVSGVMTEINRSEKYVVVNNKFILRYDYLVLTCGLQYLSPIPQAVALSQKMKPKNYKSSLSRFLQRPKTVLSQTVPKNLHNMFLVNSSRDAQKAIHYIQKLMQTVTVGGKKIIVYGHDLHVLLTINTLLKFGIPGEFIAFVEPLLSGRSSNRWFNDNSVDQAVIQLVKESKVNYYSDYFLYDWSLSLDNCITSINFHSSRTQITIPCLAFFPFIEKLVSEVTFNACNDANLVYDGRLVINHNFRTNDNYIYAAGSFTKYARRYYASERNHQHYNSREVGQKLADIIREKIDPFVEKESQEVSDLVPQLVAPIFFHCQLPGGFNFFNLRKPGKEEALEIAYNMEDYGEVLTTGDCKLKEGSGYFRLHLNAEGFVESITCFSKKKIDFLNLSSLYGLHERLLNNLLLRFDLAKIPDFFEYFSQPWALALFHEKFQSLRNINYEVFFQRVFEEETFFEMVVGELTANDWVSLDGTAKKNLELKYMFSELRDDIKNNLIQFLECFKNDLPVYATPSAVKRLFKNKK